MVAGFQKSLCRAEFSELCEKHADKPAYSGLQLNNNTAISYSPQKCKKILEKLNSVLLFAICQLLEISVKSDRFRRGASNEVRVYLFLCFHQRLLLRYFKSWSALIYSGVMTQPKQPLSLYALNYINVDVNISLLHQRRYSPQPMRNRS